jgi:hypothetical protein
MVVNLLGFKINTLDNASFTNFGPNQFIDQLVTYKRNYGIGEQNGDISPTNIPIAWVIDPDISESNAVKNSVI